MKKIIYLIVFSLTLGSCISNKRLIYMQEEEDTIAPNLEELALTRYEYKLQEGDILQVQITSLDPDINIIFNSRGASVPINDTNSPLVNLLGFVINGSGYIKLPIIGDINVKGKTIREAEILIQQGVDQYLKGASATCKLLSPRITILGEVKLSGSYPLFRNEISILEALGLAGDLTEIGDRTKVRVIRHQGTTKRVTYLVDLTKKDFLTSSFFFLQPNDIIYIPPIKAKSKRSNIPIGATVLSTILSLITTSLVVVNTLK